MRNSNVNAILLLWIYSLNQFTFHNITKIKEFQLTNHDMNIVYKLSCNNTLALSNNSNFMCMISENSFSFWKDRAMFFNVSNR
jgi:hypothetical protein